MKAGKTFKKRLKITLSIISIPILVAGVLVSILYWKQKEIVQELIATVNQDFQGRLAIEDSYISPFANFPYISIDLQNVKVYETKASNEEPLLEIEDIYVGFDFWTLATGKMQIKSLKLANGFLKLVQRTDETFNITHALSSKKDTQDTTGGEFHLDLRKIHLVNIDLLKLNEANNVLVKAFVEDAQSQLKTSEDHIKMALDSRFSLSLVIDGDTSFVHNKHVSVHTQLDFRKTDNILAIQPSEVILENALFLMDGKIDLAQDMDLDINFTGNKPNFDLFLAFAPPELAPTLERYDNGGQIFFEAKIKGKSINGYNPLVTVDFGCKEAFVNNTVSDKKIDELFFRGHFTNGEQRHVSTMEFSLMDFSARPEAGTFRGDLTVKNFSSPEIDMQLASEFDLGFLAEFLNITGLQDLQGEVTLTMNFHDIIDLDNPEKSIEKLNESYYTELEVNDLSFKAPGYHLPVQKVDIKAHMDGHKALIDKFYLKVGDSDVEIQASVSDLPAILHHTDIPVIADMSIRSNLLDLGQLTQADTSKGMNERVKDLSMKLKFNSSARAFTESPNLPIGEFFIKDLYAQMTHYPHTLHDFHADVFIDESDFRVIDFTGMIDKSDFHFSGRLQNYDLWFEENPSGDTKIEFDLVSNLLQLEDVFSYEGENYVPEDYRHEEFRDLLVRGHADLHFNEILTSSDIYIDKMEAQMKIHPMRFENFNGRVHIENDHLTVEGFSGKLGNSQVTADLGYSLKNDSTAQGKSNYFSLKAPRLDFDQIFNYTPPPSPYAASPKEHEDGFNIFELPFRDMKFDFDIKEVNYHRYLLEDFVMKANMKKNHFVYIDTMTLAVAGGDIQLKGYFNGSDSNRIYFSPEMIVKNLNLDQVLFKFENFGQDHLVSENLAGRFNGRLAGKVLMHANMVPILDDSELDLEMEVIKGTLKDYAAFDALSDYFKDKNLSKVLFDTLRNKLELREGTLRIPSMNINSSLGFFEVSGQQDADLNMEYYLRIPWKLVTRVGVQKLFGSRQENNEAQVDEIQYRDENKRVRFLNLKISGTPDDYTVSPGRDKTQYN
ncbi:MAG: AsmA-like C-terminal region-containing protein [Cytophagales bacterium]|nr:AsmA-like C-terminal region-containing protein [Cytophagales bacterium]